MVFCAPEARLKFDIVVAGSSPIMLIEAYFHALSGKTVAILEEAAHPGGAWYTRDIWGLKSIEMGCHILEKYNGAAYRFLKNRIGMVLVPVRPQPIAILDHMTISQQLNSLWYDIRCFLGAVLTLRIKVIPSLFLRFLRTFTGIIMFSDYLYPENGCGRMIEVLVELNKKAGVNFFFNSTLRSVHINDAGPNYCETASGRIDFKQLIASPNLRVDRVYHTGRQIEVPKRESKVLHVILDLEAEKKNNFSYVNILNKNSFIIRVSDVGDRNFKRGELIAKGRLIVCVQLERNIENRITNQLAEKTLEELVRLGLLRSDASVKQHHVEYFSASSINPSAISTFRKKLQPHVTLLDTSDLTAGIAYYAQRWLKREKSRV